MLYCKLMQQVVRRSLNFSNRLPGISLHVQICVCGCDDDSPPPPRLKLAWTIV